MNIGDTFRICIVNNYDYYMIEINDYKYKYNHRISCNQITRL